MRTNSQAISIIACLTKFGLSSSQQGINAYLFDLTHAVADGRKHRMVR
jgi:hypothetical protein